MTSLRSRSMRVCVCVCWCVCWALWGARLHVDAVVCVGLQVDGLGRLLARPGVHQRQVSQAACHSRRILASRHSTHAWGSTCHTRTSRQHGLFRHLKAQVQLCASVNANVTENSGELLVHVKDEQKKMLCIVQWNVFYFLKNDSPLLLMNSQVFMLNHSACLFIYVSVCLSDYRADLLVQNVEFYKILW